MPSEADARMWDRQRGRPGGAGSRLGGRDLHVVAGDRARRSARGESARVRIADELPELVEALDPVAQAEARVALVADVRPLVSGRWHAPPATRPGDLGFLVLDGLLAREIALGDAKATELVARGDILGLARDDDGPPQAVAVLEPARLAVLTAEVAVALGRWPEVMAALMHGMLSRCDFLAVTLAISGVRRVDDRVLMLLRQFSLRWGRVRPDGVHVPVKLTHETLARLVGARRPTVTTALAQLEDQGRLRRLPDRTWLLVSPRRPAAEPS